MRGVPWGFFVYHWELKFYCGWGFASPRREGYMLRLKSCPRCSGDSVLERDHFGWFWTCLQCGYVRDLSESEVAALPAETRPTLVA